MDTSPSARKAVFVFLGFVLMIASLLVLSQPASAVTRVPNGTTFKSPTRGVYLVANDHLYAIPNPETLTACFGGWAHVQNYTEAVVSDIIASYPAAPAPAACFVSYANGTVIKAPGNAAVYVVIGRQKFHVPSEQVLNACLGGWGNVRNISDAQMAWTNDFYPYAGTYNCPAPPPLSYPNMTTLKASGPGVVVINNGSRFVVPNPDVLNRCYGGSARVRNISDTEWNQMWAQFNDGGYAADCAPPPTASREQRAIEWSRTQLRSTRWNGWCEKFVEAAYGTTGRYASALAHANSQIARGRMNRGNRNVPAGALAFFGAHSTNRGYGHVMLSIGGGQFITSGYNANGAYITTLNGIGGAPYIGWAWADPGWSR